MGQGKHFHLIISSFSWYFKPKIDPPLVSICASVIVSALRHHSAPFHFPFVNFDLLAFLIRILPFSIFVIFTL